MKEIPLSKGYVAIVDDEDYERVSKYKWCAVKTKNFVYAVRSYERHKLIYMHRFILNISDNKDTDHRDGDGLNNRRLNIRASTRSQNNCNRRKPRSNTSGYKGVSWNKKADKWKVTIGLHKQSIHLGMFANLKDASQAYIKVAKKYHGEFARIS